MLFGIDLGGTKIEGVVLANSHNMDSLFRERILTEANQGYSHIVDQIVKMVDMMATDTGIRPMKLGIGTPGTVDPSTGLMKNCNTTTLNGQPLPKDLEDRLGIPVAITNDANCFALAESRMGSGVGYSTVFGIILGTGVGGGIVVNGHALTGAQGIGGEWGHNELVLNGNQCYCGKKGCVETYLSGPFLEKRYEDCSGTSLSLKDIAKNHQKGADPIATQVIRELCDGFGKAISVVLNILDPDVVILGGGVSNIPELRTWGVEACRSWVFNDRLDTKFLMPKRGDSAGVFGAALLVSD